MQTIEVISIPVSDQQKSKEFYQKLGFEIITETNMGDGNTWLQLGIPGQATTITLVTWFKKMPPGSLQGMVLRSVDIEKEVADLRVKGISVEDIDNTPWGRFASFSDPDGNGFTLRQG